MSNEEVCLPMPAEALVKRAVLHFNKQRSGKHPRWVRMMEIFGLGSSYAIQLCRACGVDPDEEI